MASTETVKVEWPEALEANESDGESDGAFVEDAHTVGNVAVCDIVRDTEGESDATCVTEG